MRLSNDEKQELISLIKYEWNKYPHLSFFEFMNEVLDAASDNDIKEGKDALWREDMSILKTLRHGYTYIENGK